MISWALPTAGTGIKTLPSLSKVSLIIVVIRCSASALVGIMSPGAPYVLSVIIVSTLGNMETAGSRSIDLPNL